MQAIAKGAANFFKFKREQKNESLKQIITSKHFLIIIFLNKTHGLRNDFDFQIYFQNYIPTSKFIFHFLTSDCEMRKQLTLSRVVLN